MESFTWFDGVSYINYLVIVKLASFLSNSKTSSISFSALSSSAPRKIAMSLMNFIYAFTIGSSTLLTKIFLSIEPKPNEVSPMYNDLL